MGKIQSFTMLVLVLSVANAWGAGLLDDFNRPNGDLGNDWATQTNGTIQVTIVDNEVLIAGEQATDWTRSGLSRDAGGETRISFDFKADDNFNVHIRIDDVETAAFIDFYAWPGGPFSYAAPEDGSWPGWTAVDGSNMIAGEYNNLVLEQFGTEFMYTLNGVVISTITNAALTTIGDVLISCDSAAGTAGSLHIDNVQIGVVHVQTARDPSPENGAMHADTWVNVSWSPGNFAASHDVYFGDNFDDVDNGAGDSFRGNQADTNYLVGFPGFPYPEGLVPGTTYYWRVDEVNEADPNSPWRGNTWSFSIPPKTAYNPDPTDGAEFVDVDSRLRWTPGFGSVLSTVYIGTDYAEVDSAAGGVPQGPANYDPGTLELEKVYYWRVDAFEPP
ncbi:MAG: fibronectin type III domain-containing protein, partial [Planctomycetota bacterium]